MIEQMEVKDWLTMNAKLQTKKNALRADLASRGILQQKGDNTYDRYKYFSEAQYKLLFTELFSKYKLELKFTELEYITFEGSEKQANGRMPRIEFSLMDAETGFYETTVITGEGIDKGDKAGYKAYTGALKYYLANTFMVATGDDPENESPQETMNQKRNSSKSNATQNAPSATKTTPPATQNAPSDPKKVTQAQADILRQTITGANMERLLTKNNITRIEDLPREKGDELIKWLHEREKAKKQAEHQAQGFEELTAEELPFPDAGK